MIDVTRAILLHEGAVLAAQRPETMSLPLKWELPGGKPDPGEDLLTCLHRELMEELRILVTVQEVLEPYSRVFRGKEYRIQPYLCSWAGGTIELVEHRAVCWQPLEELLELDWGPAERQVLHDWLKGFQDSGSHSS